MVAKRSQKILIKDLGFKNYKSVLSLQKGLQKQRIAGKSEDTLFLVEHEPVYTLGKNANSHHLLQSRDQSVKVYYTERGGDVTFHGPGQLVGYPILDLRNYKKNISWYMRTLEEVIIKVLKEFDINAQRIKGLTGVWVGDKKIAAQGGAFLPIWLVNPKAWSLKDISQPEFSKDGLIILKNLERD